ncbi:MAG TPA: GAF domain-containing protein, partial [Anaerolinea sp.]|nr:GAF domain-containing protein [Anaerolinea sp.]
GDGEINSEVIQPLLQTSTSRPVFNPFKSSQTGLVLLTSQAVQVQGGSSTYTLLGISPASTYQRALAQAAAFLPDARAFFVQSDGSVLVSGKNNALEILPAQDTFANAVGPVIQGVQTLQPITFVSYDNQLVLVYVRAIPEQNVSLVLQVPTQALFRQVPLLDGFTIYLLVTMFIILAMLAYVGASQIVNPLVQLSEVAQHFARKDFSVRAGLDRKDEIGQLAGSMDTMAGELSGLYAGLENQVEQRTAQLRIASDVARIATSATRLDDTLAQTVHLVNERFHLYYTAIYLVDETHNFLTLRSSSPTAAEDKARANRRLEMDSTSLPGLVASANQAHQIADVLQLPVQKSDDTLPETRSRAAVPISIGSAVLGVLEVHSRQPHGIDSELLFVLQTVANQVAGAIQNMRLLETTQVDLDETNLLYRITRQVTAAADEKQAIDTIVESLPQLPHVSALLHMTGDQINIIALYDPRTRKLELGLNTVNIPAQKMAAPLAQGNPLFISDLSTPSDFDPILTYFQRRACRSAAILPCMQAGKPSRILVIGFLEGQSASQASLQPFINLADVISASLEKFSVLSTLQHRLQELQVLATFSKTTSAETSLSQLFVVLHQLVVETMGSNLGFVIASYNPEREMIEFPFAYEDQQQLELDPMPLGNGLTSYIIQTRQPLLLTKDTEARAQELGARIIGKPAKSWLGVPLMVSGQLTGAIIVQDQHREDRFSQDDLNLMLTLAPQIATAIRNTRLLDEMQLDLAGYRQDRLFLTTWLSNTPDQITIKDTNGTYIYASRSVGERLDTLAQNLVDKSDFDLMPQEIASSIYALDKEVIETGNARYGDIEQTGSTGAENWELVTRIPIRDAAGSVTGLMSIRRNVTDMKQAEAFARNQAEAVRTTAEIARDAAGILDIDELLNKAVNLVRDRFNFYHASVFLLDPLGEYAVLRESTGEAGRQMKENRHRLAVGSKSIVGQSTARAEPVIVPDVTRDSTHFPNPLLPDTRAEMAIPLIFGGKVIGALDVQSTQPN